jgi:hypothetical protein
LHCRRVDIDANALATGRKQDPEGKLSHEAETYHSDALTYNDFALAHAVQRDCADR